jgi:phage tail-like protein
MPSTVPLQTFSFQMSWSLHRPQVMRVSGLGWVTAVTSHHDGTKTPTINQVLPGLTTYQPITIEREVLQGDEEFQSWATQAMNQVAGYQQDIAIVLLDAQANPVVRFLLSGAWPSAYDAFVELTADATGVVTERITLQYQSFKRTDS